MGVLEGEGTRPGPSTSTLSIASEARIRRRFFGWRGEAWNREKSARNEILEFNKYVGVIRLGGGLRLRQRPLVKNLISISGDVRKKPHRAQGRKTLDLSILCFPIFSPA